MMTDTENPPENRCITQRQVDRLWARLVEISAARGARNPAPEPIDTDPTSGS